MIEERSSPFCSLQRFLLGAIDMDPENRVGRRSFVDRASEDAYRTDRDAMACDSEFVLCKAGIVLPECDRMHVAECQSRQYRICWIIMVGPSQTSALQQATTFLGATNRTRRNKKEKEIMARHSDRCFILRRFLDTRRERYCATGQRMVHVPASTLG